MEPTQIQKLSKSKGRGRQRRSKSFFADIASNPISYLLALPGLLYIFVFSYLTYPYFAIAFQRYNFRLGVFRSPWVGLENFRFFLESNQIAVITYNTLRLNALFIVFPTLLAVVLALLLNEVRSKRFAKITQSIYLLPHFLSWVVVSYMIYNLFATRLGIVNQVLSSLGIDTVNWYAEAGPWPAILTGMRIWKFAGMNTVVFLAAITGLDEQLFEAATIDGATRPKQIWYITIPLLMPTVVILTLLQVGRIFYGDYAMIYSIVRDNGVLFPTTDVIDTYVFRALRKIGDPSWAMAVGLYQAILGFLFVAGSNWAARRLFPEGAIY